MEVVPGLVAGQRLIPVSSAGCYIPGGRYSHIASAIMTVTTARVAGVQHITACSPPRKDVGIAPAIVHAAKVCGANQILAMGGVQGIASMAFGLFDLPQADILVGPGNQFVAEAKRILFGRVGIDMFAGPTDSLILADGDADPEIVAVDLVSQAEHGYNSPVWLVTNDESLPTQSSPAPELIADLPGQNGERGRSLARLCRSGAVQTGRKWPRFRWLRARTPDRAGRRSGLVAAAAANYGSLFLGEETTVSFGDKALARTTCCRPTARQVHRRPVSAQVHEDCHGNATREACAGGAGGGRISGLKAWRAMPAPLTCGSPSISPVRTSTSALKARRVTAVPSEPLFSLAGKVACVTGASGGLGRPAPPSLRRRAPVSSASRDGKTN